MIRDVPAYRVTPDDLVDADRKTQLALTPLLEALNRSLAGIVTTVNNLAVPEAKATSFTTAANGAQYVDLGLRRPATEMWVSGLFPESGTLDSVWSMSWIPTADGARLLFQGLAPLTTYALRVRYQ